MVVPRVAYPALADYFTPVPSAFTGGRLILKPLKYSLKGSAMTENLEPQKPTWFELTDGDAPSAQVTKVNKKIPALAVLVTGVVIASGAFFAHASDSESVDENPSSTSINQVDNTTSANSGLTTEISNTQPATPNKSGTVIATVKNGVQEPAQPGMKAPTGKSHDDDEDDDHEDRERKGHERGEGRERGEH